MIQLAPSNVRLGAKAGNKEEAIRLVGDLLVKNGFISAGYIESLLGREKQANTYLGNGIAIPHGMTKDRDLIQRTGVCVVQFPQGVTWNEGQIVNLAVGIAALSDEHIGILAALTDVLDDPNAATRLATTTNPADVVAALTRKVEDSAPAEELSGAQTLELTILGKAGLHARPATMFAEVAGRFESDVQVRHGDKAANGKSLGSLLKLGVPGGGVIRVSASGHDAVQTLAALQEAVEQGLGEVEEKETSASTALRWKPESEGHFMAGVSASPGLAIGRIYQFQASRIVVQDQPKDRGAEELMLKQAIAAASAQISDIYEQVAKNTGKSEAAIFRAHLALLKDEELFHEVLVQIDAGHSAAWSWQKAIERRTKEMSQLENERLAERATDLHDVGQRVLRLLAGTEQSEHFLPEEPVILVADDLSPSDTARLDPKRVLGLCTASGGPTAHTAIIARSLDIPAIVGAGAAVLELTDGQRCILDGTAGKIYIDPTPEDFKSAKGFQIDLHEQRDEEYVTRYQPVIFADGHRVEVVANIGKAAEAKAAVDAGAEGIGLLRTEFLFLGRTSAPTEDEQFESYRQMTQALNGLPLIIRTLDIGGDKVVPYISLPKEENPFLGVRGIRLCLRQPELFLPQLRAIYRASATGPVKIMFPMISTLEDLRAAKQLAEQVRREIGVPAVSMGIMVEVPSTVLMAPEFAREVDFFSIGTNDLTQYTMAMDRLHASLAKSVDGLYPAVLRMIDMTVRAAKAEGKWVGVCGGVAGDPLGAAILTGLGVTELSVSLPSIAAVKAGLRHLTHEQTKAIAQKALACKSAEEVRQLRIV